MGGYGIDIRFRIRGGWVAVLGLEGRILLINLHYSEVFRRDILEILCISDSTDTIVRTHTWRSPSASTQPHDETGYHDTDVHTITWKMHAVAYILKSSLVQVYVCDILMLPIKPVSKIYKLKNKMTYEVFLSHTHLS